MNLTYYSDLSNDHLSGRTSPSAISTPEKRESNEEPLQKGSFTTSSHETRAVKWLYLENHRNGIKARASNSLALYTEFPSQYRPGGAPYELPIYLVDRAACQIFVSARANPVLVEKFLPSTDQIPYPVHPVNLNNPAIPHIEKVISCFLKTLSVQATSSTRTVYVWDSAANYCLKPHTDLTITKWRRHMELRKVKQAVAITKILEQSSVFLNNPKVAYYPESIGVAYGKGERTDWGYIIREMDAQPLLQRPYHMIPLCSLYMANEEETPILVDMINNSNKDPFTVICDEIILPMLEGWIQVYLETGILFEPHGQNVVVEVDDSTGEIIRFAHRDFDCTVNKDIAEHNGFSTDELNAWGLFTTEGNEKQPQGMFASSYFDHSVSVPLEALANLGQRHFGIEQEAMRTYCHHQLLSKYPTFFSQHLPPVGISYKFEKDEDGHHVLVKLNHSSPWR